MLRMPYLRFLVTLTKNLSESDLEFIESSKNQAKDQEFPRPNLSYSQLIAEALVNSQNGKLILVTAINPTPAGEE